MSAGRDTRRSWPAAWRLPVERHSVVRHDSGGFSFATAEFGGGGPWSSRFPEGFRLSAEQRFFVFVRRNQEGQEIHLTAAEILDRAISSVCPREHHERRQVYRLFYGAKDGRVATHYEGLETVSIVADLEPHPAIWKPLAARYEGRCQVCNRRFSPGTAILWNRYRGSIHAACGAPLEARV